MQESFKIIMDLKDLYQEIIFDHGKNQGTSENVKILPAMQKVIILYVVIKFIFTLNLIKIKKFKSLF